MTTPEKPKSYTLNEGQKATQVMAYTQNIFAWGTVVTMEAIRVSLWMRTPSVPQYISLHDAQVLYLGGSTAIKPQSFRVLYVPSSQIIAFHIMPPNRDPLDYDAGEPHRKMEPATALIGEFRFDGLARMSDQTNLERYLDVTKETFTPLYEVEITHPGMPALGVIKVPYVLLRRDMVIFSPRVA